MFDHVGFGFSDKPLEVKTNYLIYNSNQTVIEFQYKQSVEQTNVFYIFQNYTYSLIDQAENAVSLWMQLGISRAHIVSHDMGDSVLTEIITLKEKNMLEGKLRKDFFKVGNELFD